jgi:hypothetical protein
MVTARDQNQNRDSIQKRFGFGKLPLQVKQDISHFWRIEECQKGRSSRCGRIILV